MWLSVCVCKSAYVWKRLCVNDEDWDRNGDGNDDSGDNDDDDYDDDDDDDDDGDDDECESEGEAQDEVLELPSKLLSCTCWAQKLVGWVSFMSCCKVCIGW